MKRWIPLLAFVLLTGCQLPEWRVMQAKVPAPVQKTAGQVETDRRAADLIARQIEEPKFLKPVADGLSESLGRPAKPIDITAPSEAAHVSASELRESVVKTQAMERAQNERLAQYAGKEIEGTGFNLFGPSMGLIVIGLIVLGVLCPPALTLIFFVLKRTRAALATTVDSIESFSKEEPRAAEKLKLLQSRAMDAAHKRLVKKLKVQL